MRSSRARRYAPSVLCVQGSLADLQSHRASDTISCVFVHGISHQPRSAHFALCSQPAIEPSATAFSPEVSTSASPVASSAGSRVYALLLTAFVTLYLLWSITGNRPSTGTDDDMQQQQQNPSLFMQANHHHGAVQTLEAAVRGEPIFANREVRAPPHGNPDASASAQPHSHDRQLRQHKPATSSSSKPHALQSFDTIAGTLKGKQLAIFLDYDGTLTPIVSDPAQARITPETTATIEQLAQRHPTAIVTGRKIDTIRGFLNLPSLYYAGSHGFDIRKPGGDKLKQVADDYLAELGQVRDDVRRRVEGVKGSLVEDNVYSVSVHYRNADDDGKQTIERAVKEAFVGHEGRLQLLPGKMVHEIRPAIEWHKGEAVEYLLSVMYEQGERGGKAAVAMGDDTTDEDAFKLLESDDSSVTVLVLPDGGGERQTNAKYVCQQPEVGDFLKRLAAL